MELLLESPGMLVHRPVSTLDTPLGSQIRVMMLLGGICGSDVKTFKGGLAHAKYPMRPGHEMLGIVTEAGPDSPYNVGTRVVAYPNTYCGTCEACRQGMTNICENKQSHGVTIDGFFSGEMIMDSEYAVAVPFVLPDERAVLAEPLAVVLHAVSKVRFKRDMRAAVIGCGTEGLLSTSVLRHLGASVTAIDTNEKKLVYATAVGPDVRACLQDAVAGERFDLVVEAAGTKGAVESAFRMVKPGGHVLLIGLTAENPEFPAMQMVRSEITVTGSIIYTRQDFATAISMLADSRFVTAPVVTKIFPVAQYKKAWDAAMSGDHAKVLIRFQ